MTRIIFQWMLIFIIGGILLLVSGDSAVPTLPEGKAPNSVTPLILSATENSSSDISSDSVAPNTENTREESENLASTTTNIELDEASKTSEPQDGNQTHNFVNSEKLSTDVLTTSISTDPSSEGSINTNSVSSTGENEMASTSKDNIRSGNESEVGTKPQNAEDASDKSFPSPSSEIFETSTNILNTEYEIQSSSDSFSTKSSEQGTSLAESSMSQSSSEKSSTDGTLVEGKTSDKMSEGLTTEAEAEMETVETADKKDKSTPEDLTPENLLSLHKTTPKSATKKRSLNNTGDSTLHRETTTASDTFSSTSLQPELITLVEHGDSSTSESVDETLTKYNMSGDIALEESSSNKSLDEPLSDMPVPSIPLELGTVGNTEEKMEKFEIPFPEKIQTSSVKESDDLGAKKTAEVKIKTESSSPMFNSEASMVVPKTSDDYSHLNNLDNIDNTFTGVTFDPNGMKNDEPQDPDSVVFYVPSTNTDKVSTAENAHPSTAFTGYENSESEREFEFVTHKNLKEGGENGNGSEESEKMEYLPPHKNMNISPPPSHNPMDSSEMVTFETANNSNSSSGFVFWDPSNGGWILPETSTDTPIKRFDTVNDESEEMLQDAPHFPESPSAIHKIEPKEKDEPKTTIRDEVPSFTKRLETETATELGSVVSSNSFVPHQTDQSVIRPVKIKLSSPDDKSVVSTSILPESFSTLAPEQPTGLKLSEPTTTGTMIQKIETSSTNNTSSPIILPKPAPSVTTEVVKNPELSTIVIQPELVPVSFDKKTPEATETSNTTSVADSTIAGIAVKTSVSVSLPLSKKNDSQALQPVIEELLKKMNLSSLSINASSSPLPETSASSAPTPSESSTDGLTITSDQTTTASGFKIRKPKIRIPGVSDSATPRPYRPFSPAPKKPTTTAGPAVSIFKKQRTRIASITSSTTARPLRAFTGGNFATVKIQYASDMAGLLPEGFVFSTEPVTTTTTTEPTTTEEPISEVPFTDQTHIPTVANEDDVTLVKVAGYVVIDRGLHWNDLLHNRHSPEYKKNAEAMHLYLDRMFRSSPIASRLWKIEIDGFSGNKKTRPVGIDFFLYLIKTRENIPTQHLATVFHEKLSVNNTFGTFRVDPSKTAFEMIQEEPLKAPPPPPEEENVEPPIPQWAIAVIVIGAASLIFIVLFAAVTIYGRHHMRRRYSSKLSEEDMERSSGEWESKMAAAYENMAADTIYDAEDLHSDSYKKSSRIATFHGIPSTLKRSDSWSSNGWTTPPKRKRPHVH